jgi:hypothetical protein
MIFNTKKYMSQQLLFDLPPAIEVENTCRHCAHRQRWGCGGSIIQYCGVRKSNRTRNGLLKIKVTDKACEAFKMEVKIKLI